MAWRVATSLVTLRTELNAAWPDRDTSSDGLIGDAAHASTGSASDHNPWVIDADGIGVVRAYDIDVDLDGNNVGNYQGQAIVALAEHFRQMGIVGDPRLTGGGYVIFANHIASENGNWIWRPYSGADPHTSHIHLSVSRTTHYDDTDAWGISDPGTGDEDLPLNGNDMVLINEAVKAQCDAAFERACKLNEGFVDKLLQARVINLQQMNELVQAQNDAAFVRACAPPDGPIAKALAADH